MTSKQKKAAHAKPNKQLEEVRDQLVEAIHNADVIRMQLGQLQRNIANLEGQQEALAKIFFADADMPHQEAFDKDWNGVKTAYEKLRNASP